ncbi:MAG: hypothetical protein ACKVZ0_08015 [Gemmatimonadales bacterium]
MITGIRGTPHEGRLTEGPTFTAVLLAWGAHPDAILATHHRLKSRHQRMETVLVCCNDATTVATAHQIGAVLVIGPEDKPDLAAMRRLGAAQASGDVIHFEIIDRPVDGAVELPADWPARLRAAGVPVPSQGR